MQMNVNNNSLAKDDANPFEIAKDIQPASAEYDQGVTNSALPTTQPAGLVDPQPSNNQQSESQATVPPGVGQTQINNQATTHQSSSLDLPQSKVGTQGVGPNAIYSQNVVDQKQG